MRGATVATHSGTTVVARVVNLILTTGAFSWSFIVLGICSFIALLRHGALALTRGHFGPEEGGQDQGVHASVYPVTGLVLAGAFTMPANGGRPCPLLSALLRACVLTLGGTVELVAICSWCIHFCASLSVFRLSLCAVSCFAFTLRAPADLITQFASNACCSFLAHPLYQGPRIGLGFHL